MNAGNADRSAARLSDLLEAFAVEAELAGLLAGGLEQSDSFVADLAADALLYTVFAHRIVLSAADHLAAPGAEA